jgi:hypothetical protein
VFDVGRVTRADHDLREGAADERQGGLKAGFDEGGRETESAVAEAGEFAVAAGVRGAAARVVGAVHFDDEVLRGSDEVSDVTAEWDLAAEPSAELSRVDGGPEFLFGRGEGATVLTSARRERVAIREGSEWLTHEWFLGPGCGRATPHPAQDP